MTDLILTNCSRFMHLKAIESGLSDFHKVTTTIMTTLAGGFLVTNYHDAGHKVSKSNLDRGRKQKRPLHPTAVDAWRG